MSEGTRSRKPKAPVEPGSPRALNDRTVPVAQRSPAWAGAPAPFALAGVQRKVEIGEVGDVHEQQAESVAQRVASGQSISPSMITPIGATPSAAGQRAPKHDDKKPAPVQKAETPPKHNEPPKKSPIQRETAAEDNHPDVQMASRPDDKKNKDVKPAVQKADAPSKKEEQPKSRAVQKAESPKKKSESPNRGAVQKAESPKKKSEPPKGGPVQKAEAPKKEEKPKSKAVQKATAKKDEKSRPPVQKAASKAHEPREDALGSVQKAAGADEKKKETPPPGKAGAKAAQRAASPAAGSGAPAAAPAATPSMESTAASAISSKGAGEPMHGGTRQAVESRMGVDLGGVRVHEDDTARDNATAINARAFTHGSDIWLGPGESQSNVGLMAHEATHVVQQAGGVHRMVQRAKGKDKDVPEETDWDFESKEGKIKKGKALSIPKLKVPTFKKEATPSPLTLRKKDEESARSDKQRTIWENAAKGEGSAVDSKLEKKLKAKGPGAKGEGDAPEADPIFFVRPKEAEDFFIIGTKAQIKERMLRPYWDKEGKRSPHDVDHKQEHQLAQEGEDPDRLDNFWLLESWVNQKSGRNIKVEKEQKIRALLDAATIPAKKKSKKKSSKDEPTQPPPTKADGSPAKKNAPIFTKKPKLDDVRANYAITFEKVEGGLDPDVKKPKIWELDEVKRGDPVDELKLLTPQEIKSANLKGTKKELAIYTSETGGFRKSVPYDVDSKKSKEPVIFGSKKKSLFQFDSVTYDEDKKKGKVQATAFKNNKLIEEATFPLDIQPMNAVDFGGFIPRSDTYSAVKSALKAVGMSPIDLDNVELTDRGLVGRGRILPTVPVIKDIGIDLVLDGDEIYLSKVFSAGDIQLPGPIQVTSATLEIFGGTPGFGLKGDVFFEIDRVGKGQLSAKAVVGQGFSIRGGFDFDSDLFDEAHVEVWYEKETFGGKGHLKISDGKIRGIKSAELDASFEGERIDAKGVVKPNMPAVEQGSLEFHYDPKTGIVISGRLDLKKDTPGIESGWVFAELAKPAGEENWRLKAHGEAVPKIPGINAKLIVDYDDGLFDVAGMASYDKGMLKGSVMVGATNRPVSPEGTPSGEPTGKGDKITIYGGGSVTMRIAPWLQATAGIRLLPNGEIEVVGEIALPSTLDIFPGKNYDKNLFKIAIDIPIVGLSVAGQHVGIFASIGGGLDLSAGVGPGQLQDVHLGVTYNPSHEDQTHVEGGAKLHIPAHAGLRLFVRGSLGVGIPLVDAQAGLEVGGSIGLEGAVDAAVQVDWTPNKGLQIDAFGEIYVQPKFKFDVTGFVLVELDLLIDTIELYSKKWELASVEYGSDLRFGVKFPIKYREGQPFDLSLSDLQFETPNVDASDVLKGLIDKIA